MTNAHERSLSADLETVWTLVTSLSADDDELWPRGRWPRMRLDRPLEVGARGGHGPVRYQVAEIRPKQTVAFRFTPDFGLVGTHRFEIVEQGRRTVLRHVIEGRPRRFMHLVWPLALRPLHDALVEDGLDRAEAAVTGQPWRPRPLSFRVQLLRRLVRPRRGRATT